MIAVCIKFVVGSFQNILFVAIKYYTKHTFSTVPFKSFKLVIRVFLLE